MRSSSCGGCSVPGHHRQVLGDGAIQDIGRGEAMLFSPVRPRPPERSADLPTGEVCSFGSAPAHINRQWPSARKGIIGSKRRPVSTFPRLKMLRILTKCSGCSPTPASPESPQAHQIADIGAVPDSGAEGEYPRRHISGPKTDKTDLTIAPDTNRAVGSEIVIQDGRIENQQPPAPNAPTPIPEHEGGDAS